MKVCTIKNLENKEYVTMRNSKVILSVIVMVIVIVITVHPVVQAGQNLTIWPIEDVRGDSSTGSLTLYYEVVGWDDDAGEELVMIFFFLRLYEKKTRTWQMISAVADTTFRLTQDALVGMQQQELVEFFNGAVRENLKPGYTSVHLTSVENDFENLTGNKPPYAVGADITLVAK
jgi:hypothetical protein